MRCSHVHGLVPANPPDVDVCPLIQQEASHIGAPGSCCPVKRRIATRIQLVHCHSLGEDSGFRTPHVLVDWDSGAVSMD
jgi:hypothetical protein